VGNDSRQRGFHAWSILDTSCHENNHAFETYKIVGTHPATYEQDLKALKAIKSRFGVKDWIFDPCFLIQWNRIICESSTSDIRISEMKESYRIGASRYWTVGGIN
jgi:hypothetical protein